MFREIFLQMGFEEMQTNKFVESSFWNFDALYQPQQHPARDEHDTFFVKTPAETLQIPMDYLQRVKATHEDGGGGAPRPHATMESNLPAVPETPSKCSEVSAVEDINIDM